MKKLSILLLLFLTTQFGIAQNTVTINGKITNPNGNKVYVDFEKDHLTYETEIADSAELDNEGNFSMTFKWDRPGPAYFNHGDEYTQMYLKPDDQYTITLDADLFDESIRYNSKGTDLNTYYAKTYLMFPSRSSEDIYKVDEQTFIRTEDSIRLKQLDFLNNYFSVITNKNPDVYAFLNYEEAQINYNWAEIRKSYAYFHKHFNKLEDTVIVSKNFNDFQKFAPVQNPKAIESGVYKNYVITHVNDEIYAKITKDSSLDAIQIKEEFIDKEFEGEMKEFLYANWIISLLERGSDIENSERLIHKLKTFAQNKRYLEILNNELALAHSLTPGKPAPEFTLKDVNGNIVSLSDFRGKVVYLNFWASWCGGCIMELPHAKKLQEELKDQEIVFLYVTLDDDESAWKKMIALKELNGIHLIIPRGSYRSGVTLLYNIKGVPQYVIIGKDGKIVNYNADRPSGNVKNDLEKLLK